MPVSLFMTDDALVHGYEMFWVMVWTEGEHAIVEFWTLVWTEVDVSTCMEVTHEVRVDHLVKVFVS